MLLSIWKYAIFAAAMVAAIITPDPTAVSMLIVLIALSTLYFASILLLKLFGR
jgi:Sec-independent protein secretion pathway component TatC